jgi:glycine betaine/choline ABC-type transport system substrate-binding protein
MNRQDGFPGFSRTYGLRFANVSDMSLDLTYTALASHKVDMIAGNSTDGRVAALDLVQLEDDKRYFPPYEAVFVIRRGVHALGSVPENSRLIDPLVVVMGKLDGTISTDEMRKLNYEVDGAKRDKKTVVHEWLAKKGLLTSGQ